MKYRLIIAADEGKILTNGKEKKHMVYLDNSTDYSAWTEADIPDADTPTADEGDKSGGDVT